MKKKILFVAAVVVVLSILAAGTLAYFTSRTVVHNVITTGSIQIDLVEQARNADGDWVDFSEVNKDNTVHGVMPSMDVDKKVFVENSGANAAFVRLEVEKVIRLAQGETTAPNPDMITMDINTENWTLRDGYYYYIGSEENPDGVLEPGAVTEPLFTTVSFAPEMGNAYQNCTVEVVVNAEGVQTANNGKTALEAAGWPA